MGSEPATCKHNTPFSPPNNDLRPPLVSNVPWSFCLRHFYKNAAEEHSGWKLFYFGNRNKKNLHILSIIEAAHYWTFGLISKLLISMLNTDIAGSPLDKHASQFLGVGNGFKSLTWGRLLDGDLKDINGHLCSAHLQSDSTMFIQRENVLATTRSTRPQGSPKMSSAQGLFTS